MNGRKIIVALSVAFLLVVAPFVSWYYLKSGLEYRLESMEQLTEKDVKNYISQLVSDVHTDGKATLVHFGRSDESLLLLRQLADRVVERETFEIYSLRSHDSFDKLDIISRPELGVETMLDFVLTDTDGIVRGVYESGEDHSKEIIRHLSVVIPTPKHRTIELKRDVLEE